MDIVKPDDAEPDFDWSWTEDDDDWVPPEIDTTVANVARMYDYYLGGKDNFPVDRAAAAKVVAAFPDIRFVAQANRSFLVHAVRFIAEAGVRQFIDLGTGIPTSPNVHDVAREVHPDARVAYVDYDPIVMAHNRALRARTPGVITIRHDIREPLNILGDPALRDLVDFDEPVAVLFVAVLHFIRHDIAPEIISRFRKVMAPGSHLAVSTLCSEKTDVSKVRELESIYSRASSPVTFRTRAQVEQLFEGMSLVEPGLADVTEWRNTGTPASLRLLCGVARRD